MHAIKYKIMSKSKWSAEKTWKFVIEYRKRECLWNTNLQFYKDRQIKDAAYTELADMFNLVGVNDVKIKIKNLRTTYIQEYKKIQESLKGISNGNEDSVYIPTLVWYKEMDSFLNYTSVGKITPVTASVSDNKTDDIDIVRKHPLTFAKFDKKRDLNKFGPAYTPENASGKIAIQSTLFQRSQAVLKNSDVHIKEEIIDITPANIEISNILDTTSQSQQTYELRLTRDMTQPMPKKRKQSLPYNQQSAQDNNDLYFEEHEFDIFGKSVAKQLKSFSSIAAALRAQSKIQSLLTEERIQDQIAASDENLRQNTANQRFFYNQGSSSSKWLNSVTVNGDISNLSNESCTSASLNEEAFGN